MNFICQFLRDESGATAIEYGLIASLLSIAIVGTLLTISGNLVQFYTDISDAVADASSGG